MENKNLLVAETITAEKLNQFLEIANVGQNLPAKKRQQFIEIAQAYGLNPFKREIYCVGYGEQTNILTGYEVYIKRAERTGKLNGWEVKIEGNAKDNSLKAIITIYRKDWEKPFTHEVYFEEVCQKTKAGALNSIWAKMPKFMTKKVAIAQGFRLCFSDELGGMPYTADELPEQEKPQAQVIQAEVVQQQMPNIKEELAKANTEQELRDIANSLMKVFPKKQITDSFNERLAELQKVQAETKSEVEK